MAKSETPAATPATEPVERETYTAKQIATRIGTDSKILRKFFRSAASTIEPCGQGGRYEFDAADLPKIKEEFDRFNTGKTPRGRKPADGAAPKTKGRQAPARAAVISEDDELLDLDDLEEEEDPTDLDLAELDEFEEEDDPVEEEDDEESDDIEEDDDEELED